MVEVGTKLSMALIRVLIEPAGSTKMVDSNEGGHERPFGSIGFPPQILFPYWGGDWKQAFRFFDSICRRFRTSAQRPATAVCVNVK